MQIHKPAPEHLYLITGMGDGEHSTLVLGWEKMKEFVISDIFGEHLYVDGKRVSTKYHPELNKEVEAYLTALENDDEWNIIQYPYGTGKYTKFRHVIGFEDGSVTIQLVTQIPDQMQI